MLAPLYVLVKNVTSAPRIAVYLCEAKLDEVRWVVGIWERNNCGVLTVEPWGDEDGDWSLRISMEYFGQLGEEVHIPFPWREPERPNLLQAIEAIRGGTAHAG